MLEPKDNPYRAIAVGREVRIISPYHTIMIKADDDYWAERVANTISMNLNAAMAVGQRQGMEEAARICAREAEDGRNAAKGCRRRGEEHDAVELTNFAAASDALASAIRALIPYGSSTSKLSHVCAEHFHCCAISDHECLACEYEKSELNAESTLDDDTYPPQFDPPRGDGPDMWTKQQQHLDILRSSSCATCNGREQVPEVVPQSRRVGVVPCPRCQPQDGKQ